MSDHLSNVDEIFCAAIELSSPEERGEYVERACGGNAELRHRVDALLAAHFGAGDFLERSPATALLPDHENIQEGPGTLIGPYKLLEQIGEGGMGVVYMADQQSPVRRRVALKIIKMGMDTRQVIARFEAERQALALMDHTNIARVLDAGATESGRPYFVMELVRGIPITEYCDQNNLPVHERLELFVQVCHAVQHAHQKGIIHRDLKPSNVLVTLNDGRAVPKVIDFGVAKATGQQLTEKTLFTAFAQMVGTPLYMSPEQAEMTSVDIDTRSDIYSLGVLLYELLTGTTPFDQERMRSAAFDEIRRIIREEEPPRPSTRISTLGESRTATAAHRKVDFHQLGKLVKGDLDWIVMKALEKDRTRRYDTAGNFAADVLRHLSDEPVEACPPSTVYRFRKFARRNKGPVAAVAAILITLLLGLAISTIGFIQADRQRAIAQDNAARADREADHASAETQKHYVVNEFLYALLRSIEPTQLPANQSAKDVTILQVLDEASRFLDTGALQQNPLAEERVRTSLSMTYRDIGQIDVAERHARVAMERAKEAYGPRHAKVAERTIDLHDLLRDLGKHAEARKFADEAVSIAMASPEKSVNLIVHLVRFREAEGNLAQAEQLSREALAIARRTFGDGYSVDLVKALLTLADVLTAQQKFAEADVIYREALAKQRGQLDKNHPDVVITVNKLVENLEKQGDSAGLAALRADRIAALSKALEQRPGDVPLRLELADRNRETGDFDEALSMYSEIIAAKPDMPEAWAGRAECYAEKGDFAKATEDFSQLLKLNPTRDCRWNIGHRLRTCAGRKDWPAAEHLLRQALQIFEKLWSEDQANALNLYFLADTHRWLGNLLQSQQRLEEAEQAFRRAVQIIEEHATKYDATWMQHSQHSERAAVYLDLARLLIKTDRLEEAVPLVVRGVELDPASKGQDDKLAVQIQLGIVLGEAGEFDQASDALEEASALIKENDKPLREKIAVAYKELCFAAFNQQKFDIVESAARKAIELQPDYGEAHLWLGIALSNLGNQEAAITAYHKAIELKPDDYGNYRSLSLAFWRDGKFDEAINAIRKAIELQPERGELYVRLGSILIQQGKMEQGVAAFDKSIALNPADANMLNQLAWFLATAPESQHRDPARAVELAKKAVELAPQNGAIWNTLGVAQYRAGEWQAAIDGLQKSMDLRSGGDAADWFILSMAHWQLDHKDEARKQFDNAVEWMDKNQPKNEELLRFRAEAAELLGISEPAPSTDAAPQP